jgi:glycosyltransferase involved in cell wall biosynthesis
MSRSLTVVQVLPALESGGVERGTVEVAAELVRRGHRAIVVSGGGRLVDALVSAGAEHVQLPVGVKSPLVLRQVGALRSLLRTTRADILHARSRLPAWIGWLAWLGLRGTTGMRFITGVHGPYSVNAYSAVMTRGERVIAISRFIRDYLFKNYPRLDRTRVRLIARGVSRVEFPHGYRPPAEWLQRWHSEQPALQGRYVLTLPARITRWKGQQDFIELIARLRARGIPAHGLLAGGTEPRRRAYAAELQRDIARRGLQDFLTFLGQRADLREVMAVSDLVLSLAREPEAFGRTALEALSLGVPVIAYDHGGGGEVLGEMFRAGLVPALDVAAASERAALFHSQRPRVAASAAFLLQDMLDQTLALYAELADCQSARS